MPYIVVFGVSLLMACSQSEPTPAPTPSPTPQPAPDFRIPLYDNVDFQLSEHLGKPVIINFWASWCDPCRDEAPILERIWRKYEDRNVVVIGVNVDDIERNARAFLREFSITYLAGPDREGSVPIDYGVKGLPATYFVNKEGRLEHRWDGLIDEDTIESWIGDLVAGADPSAGPMGESIEEFLKLIGDGDTAISAAQAPLLEQAVWPPEMASQFIMECLEWIYRFKAEFPKEGPTEHEVWRVETYGEEPGCDGLTAAWHVTFYADGRPPQVSEIYDRLLREGVLQSDILTGEGIRLTSYFQGDCPRGDHPLDSAAATCWATGVYTPEIDETPTQEEVARVRGRMSVPEGYTDALLLVVPSRLDTASALPQDLAARFLLGLLVGESVDALLIPVDYYAVVGAGEWWTIEGSAADGPLPRDLWIFAEREGEPVGMKFESLPASFGSTVSLPEVEFPSVDPDERREWVLRPSE